MANKSNSDKTLRDPENLIQKQIDFTKSILNVKEACHYLGTSKSQLYKLTSENILPHSKPGGKLIYFRKADLDSWAMSNPISTQAELDMKASQHVVNAFPFNHNKKVS